MRIAYIFPPLGHGGRKVRSFPLAPPVLEYPAGLTASLRPDWDIRLINANAEDFDPGALDADFAGITILTHQASWAYRTADVLRGSGIKVIPGGPHFSVLPDEAHADAMNRRDNRISFSSPCLTGSAALSMMLPRRAMSGHFDSGC